MQLYAKWMHAQLCNCLRSRYRQKYQERVYNIAAVRYWYCYGQQYLASYADYNNKRFMLKLVLCKVTRINCGDTIIFKVFAFKCQTSASTPWYWIATSRLDELTNGIPHSSIKYSTMGILLTWIVKPVNWLWSFSFISVILGSDTCLMRSTK